jgi:hypothetical protein
MLRAKTERKAKAMAIEIGKELLRDLGKEYQSANNFTEEQVKTIGESRDDIAYSCWSYASVEALGLSAEHARACIYAALKDLEEKYRFKPANLQTCKSTGGTRTGEIKYE